MPSTALILQDAQNRSDVVPLARRGTLIHRGPGMTMLQLANLGAKFVSWVSKWAYTGPKDPMSRIVELLGEDDRTQEILDELYAGRIPGRPDALREHCHDLLKFARPGSQTDVVFLNYSIPGIRRFFDDDKEIRRASVTDPSLVKLWRRPHQDCGPEWQFYRDMAVFCVSKSPLTQLVESERPSLLGRIEFSGGNLSNVPIETLLGFCQSRPAFDLPRVCAILYLAGILELPTFWANGRSNNQRLLDMLSEISGTMLDLVCDTQETGDGGFDTSASMSVARESVDILSYAILRGVLRLHHVNGIPSGPCPRLLFEMVLCFLRDSMKGWYPRACGEAPQVNAILSFSRASPPSNPSDEDRVNRPSVDLPEGGINGNDAPTHFSGPYPIYPETSRTSHRSLPPAVAPFSLPSDSAPRTPWHTSQVSLPSVIAPSPPSSSSTDPMVYPIYPDVTPFVPPSPSQIASSPPSSPSSAPTNPHVSGMFTNHPSTPWPSYTHIPDPDVSGDTMYPIYPETPWFGPTPPYVPPIFSTYWPNTPPSGPMPDPDVPGQLIYPDAPHIFQLELSPAVAQDFPIYQPSDDSRARSPSTNAPSPS